MDKENKNISIDSISNNGNAIKIVNAKGSTGKSGISVVTGKKFTVNFDKNDNTKLIDGKYIYEGDINISGSGHINNTYNSPDPTNASLTVNFGADVKGNINANNTQNGPLSSAYYHFKNGASLTGDVNYQAGYGIFKFDGNGGISGTVSLKSTKSGSENTGWVNITLGDTGGTGTNVIGSIINNSNQIPSNFTFNQNGTINGNVQAKTTGGLVITNINFNGENNQINGDISAGWKTQNNIYFNNDKSTNLISGNINNSVGINNIIFNGLNNTIGGNIVATNGNNPDTINQIYFKNPNAINTIKGKVDANTYSSKVAKNNILATGGTLNINEISVWNGSNSNTVIVSKDQKLNTGNLDSKTSGLNYNDLSGTLNIGNITATRSKDTKNNVAANTVNIAKITAGSGVNNFYAKHLSINIGEATSSGSNIINFSGTGNTINSDTNLIQSGSGKNTIQLTVDKKTPTDTSYAADLIVEAGKTLKTTQGTTTIQLYSPTTISKIANLNLGGNISTITTAPTTGSAPAQAANTIVFDHTKNNSNQITGGVKLTLGTDNTTTTILASGENASNSFSLGNNDELTATDNAVISAENGGENIISLTGTAKIGTLNLNSKNDGVNKISINNATNNNPSIDTLNLSGSSHNVISLEGAGNLNAKTINTTSGLTVIYSAGYATGLNLSGAVKTIGDKASTFFDLPVTDTLTLNTGASIETGSGAKTIFQLDNSTSMAGLDTTSFTLDNKGSIVTTGANSQTIFNLYNVLNKTNTSSTLNLGTASGTVLAKDQGATIFNLGSTTNTITNLSKLQTNDGINQFNFINDGSTLTLSDDLTTTNGTSRFNLDNVVKTATISDASKIKTGDKGITEFVFNADGQTLKFGMPATKDTLTTSAGITNFNVGNADGSSEIGSATIDGKLVTNGTGTTNINLNSAKDNKFTLNFGSTTTAGTAPNGVTYNLNKQGAEVTLNVQQIPAQPVTTPITYTASGNTTFNFNQDATLTNNLALATGGTNTITLNLGNNHTATLTGNKMDITTLTGSGLVDLSKTDSKTQPTDFRLLTIGGTTQMKGQGLQAGDINFKLRVNPKATGAKLGGTNANTYGEVNSDRIIVNQGEGTHTLYLVSSIDDLIANGKKIAVVTVKDGNNIQFITAKVGKDGEIYEPTLTTTKTNNQGVANTDSSSTANGYTTYFLGKAVSTGVNPSYQNIYATGLQLNYGLYLANFNSLNKRLGELRHNPYTQGGWARIFGGSQTNDFNATSRTNYHTLQAGYDKTIDLNGTANHIGAALSYSTANISSKTVSNSLPVITSTGTIGQNTSRLQLNAKAKAVELALYNSYVGEKGLYSDTIAKVSFMHNNFDISNASNQTTRVKNHAFTLSQEFGYLHQLGDSQWQVTPSYEIGLGYFTGTEFSRKVGASVQTAKQNSVVTLKNKLGATLSYTGKINRLSSPQTGSVYLGSFYEYDNIFGGKININTNNGGQNQMQGLRSNGRLILNFGANANLTDKTRVYFDVQKSFGGKINTDVQLNSGIRYSF